MLDASGKKQLISALTDFITLVETKTDFATIITQATTIIIANEDDGQGDAWQRKLIRANWKQFWIDGLGVATGWFPSKNTDPAASALLDLFQHLVRLAIAGEKEPAAILGKHIEESRGAAHRWLHFVGVDLAEISHHISSNRELPPCRHSPDFCSVIWFGTKYSFTKNQAAAVRVLWQNWERGTPEVGRETVEKAAGADSRLIDVFKDQQSPTGRHPAWETMITSPVRGVYCLSKST